MDCFLYREAPAVKNLSEELHDTLNSVTKCVSSIKARPLNQRLLSLCEEVDADHSGL